MSSLRSSGLYSLWHQSGCPTLPLPNISLPTDLSNTTMRQRFCPQATGSKCQLYLEGMGLCEKNDRINSFFNIHHKTVFAGWSKLPKHSRQAHHRPKSAPSSKSMNSVRSSLKQISMLALASGRLLIFGKVLGFACGRRTIKTGIIFMLAYHNFLHLPTMGYGTDLLKFYEKFIPHAKHCASKTFTTQIESLNCRLRHYLARLHRKTLYCSKSI